MMQRLLLIGFFTFLVGMLSACAPVYKTQYKYIPPSSKMGNMCVSQCVQSKSMCQQMCEMRKETCRMRVQREGRAQYETYKEEQKRGGWSIMKDVSDFTDTQGCDNTPCGCTETFNTCYGACGGQVLERKVCVAFCDKA